MAHPHADVRQSKVERSRVASITTGYATGGAVMAPAPAPKAASKPAAKAGFAVGGAVAKSRQDRPGRASGGRVKQPTTVNVIVAPSGQQPPASLPPPGVAGPAPIARPMPSPAMGAPIPPGMPPGPGGPMPPMGPRAAGGRTYASGGAVKPGPAFEEGKRLGTQVTHSPNKSDGKDIGRKRVITYKTGGAVTSKATGQHGPKYAGGAGGGEARIQKAARAKKTFKKAP
jgi:hypothetical protein